VSGGRSALISMLVVALGLTSLAAAVFALTLQMTRISQSELSASAPAPPRTPAPTPVTVALADVAAAALDRVVTIEVAAGDTSVALGTGWLLDAGGDYVTNGHVVADQRSLRVVDRRGDAHAAVVVGIDAQQDIAVVRSPDLVGGVPLPQASSAEPPLPEPVVILASALATGHGDRIEEQLVRLHQTVPLDATGSGQPPVPGQPSVYDDMMVLKGAMVLRGNSGGPVLDVHGEVIGIVTLAAETTPQAFAIPLARVAVELHSLAQRGRPTGTP
jgi:S1-C subfamily serine protease